MTSPIRKHAVSRPVGTTEDLPAVFHGSPIKAALHRTVHTAKKSVEQLAFECRISPSYLYRACLEGESGCRFPLDLAVPLMRATGEYRLLDVMAGDCDRVAVRLAHVRALKRAEPGTVNEIAANFHTAMDRLLEAFAKPDRSAIDAVKEALRVHLREVVSLLRAVDGLPQQELL